MCGTPTDCSRARILNWIGFIRLKPLHGGQSQLKEQSVETWQVDRGTQKLECRAGMIIYAVTLCMSSGAPH